MTNNQWLIIGALGFAVLVLFCAIAFLILGSQTAPNQNTLPSIAAQLTPTHAPATAAPPVLVARIGTKVAGQTWEYTVTQTERAKMLTYSNPTPLSYARTMNAQGVFLVVYFTLKNISKSNAGIQLNDFSIKDSQDVNYSISNEFPLQSFLGIKNLRFIILPFAPTLVPGIDTPTALVFDVNPQAEGLKFVLTSENTGVDLTPTLPSSQTPQLFPTDTPARPLEPTRPSTAPPCISTTQRITSPGLPFNGGEMIPGCSKVFIVRVTAGQVLALSYLGYNSQVSEATVRDPSGVVMTGEGAAGTHYYQATTTGDYTITFKGSGHLLFGIYWETSQK